MDKLALHWKRLSTTQKKIIIAAGGLVLLVFYFSRGSPAFAATEEGRIGTAEFKVYLHGADGRRVSSWHDVPLAPETGSPYVVYYVNEIPLGTRRKFETQTSLPDNPIMQDTKNGKLRSYTYGDTFFNYGGIPQTWEDPDVIDSKSGCGGDNDPVDVMELGSSSYGIGEVVPIKVLGALALIDQDEVDWKILGIGLNDARASRWNDITDIDPALLERVKDWLINYKTTDGKPQNVLDKKMLGKHAAMTVIEKTHEQWRQLRQWERPPRDLWTGTQLVEAQVPMVTLISAAKDLAEQAGNAIADIHRSKNLHETSKGVTDEGVVDPLTLADLTSHVMITDTLAEMWPGMAVVSEEDKDTHVDELPEVHPPALDALDALDPDHKVKVDLKDVTIWVDPLDATKEFTEDLLQYITVMVCIAVDGEPVAGIIHQPFADTTGQTTDITSGDNRESRTAWAAVGHPGWFAGFAPPASTAPQSPVRVTHSRSHPGALEEPLSLIHGKGIPAGGAGYKTLMLVDGHADVYLHRTKIKKWDFCAGNALVRAAGGDMIDWKAHPFTYGDGQEFVNRGGILAALSKDSLETFVNDLASIDPSPA